jgi:hypothetical protein
MGVKSKTVDLAMKFKELAGNKGRRMFRKNDGNSGRKTTERRLSVLFGRNLSRTQCSLVLLSAVSGHSQELWPKNSAIYNHNEIRG